MERYIVIEYNDFKGEKHKDIFQNISFIWTKVEKIDYNMNEYNLKLIEIKDLANKSIDELLMMEDYIVKQV